MAELKVAVLRFKDKLEGFEKVKATIDNLQCSDGSTQGWAAIIMSVVGMLAGAIALVKFVADGRTTVAAAGRFVATRCCPSVWRF